MTTLRQLAVRECANYGGHANKIKDCCYFLDKPCRFTTDENARCRYFEQAVLPLDPELEAIYWTEQKADHGLTGEQKRRLIAVAKPRANCLRCGSIFERNSNRQKYCIKCKKAIQRDQNRNRVRKLRKSG